MCFDCQRRWQEGHKVAMEAANEHLDAQGVPEDSLLRGMAEVQLACNANPILSTVLHQCYPGIENLMQ